MLHIVVHRQMGQHCVGFSCGGFIGSGIIMLWRCFDGGDGGIERVVTSGPSGNGDSADDGGI